MKTTNTTNAVVTTIEETMSVSHLLPVVTHEALQELITQIHEEESKKLGIEIKAEFAITDSFTAKYMAACKYDLNRSQYSFVGIVKEAKTIIYYLDNIERTITSLFISKQAREKCSYYVLLHTVRHELRHAWQTTNKQEVFDTGLGLIDYYYSCESYGDRPCEKDAHEYAEAIDCGEYNFILRLCTINQLLSLRTKRPSRELRKEYHNVTMKVFLLNFKELFIKALPVLFISMLTVQVLTLIILILVLLKLA